MTEKNHFDGLGYENSFKNNAASLPGAAVAWLSDMRQKSLDNFLQVGLPGPRVEEWKYSNLTALNSGKYEVIGEKDQTVNVDQSVIDAAILDDIDGSKVVFIDGYYRKELSKIEQQDGVTLQSLNDYINNEPEEAKVLLEVVEGSTSLKSLNLALMTGGYVLLVNENIKLAKPIQVIHVLTDGSKDKSLIKRNFINISTNASAQVIESFVGVNKNSNWSQNISDISVGEGAELEIYQVQNEGDDTIHLAETHVDLAESGRFKHYSLNIGSRLSRTEIKPTLNGCHGNVELRGAFLARGGNSHDVFTHMKHLVPECDSNQVYRGVIDKGGKSAFQGKVYVAQDAQLTNADQSNKNLILDRKAEANSKPELLIYADDVKCSHGATVGELDKEALFYLKSRGMDTVAAKGLLVEAFVAEVFDGITIKSVKSRYLALAREWLGTE